MDAGTLPLMDNVWRAIYVDGMREVIAYDIKTDTFLARWDTVSNGEQMTHFAYKPEAAKPADEWIKHKRQEAKALFEAMEAERVAEKEK